MRYVFDPTQFKHYRFPTHTNDLVVDRSESGASEVFFVILEPGEAPPLHKHDTTEQVFYMLEGEGVLTIGKEDAKTYAVKPGDIVRVPFNAYHSIRAEGNKRIRYLCVDCFGAGFVADEPTFDAHVHVMCEENGWDYDKVVNSASK
jgi:mannose-6-phosphate isomerase-like protein (cupin superfamily)